MVTDAVVACVLFGFIGVMLLLPFGIMLGMALPRSRPRTAVSENRQPVSRARGTLEG